MSKHTPAPWAVQDYGDDDTPTLVIHRGETENRICFMATSGSHGDPAMIEADAHLIAAAPELLSHLKQACRQWQMYAEMVEGNGRLDLASEKSPEGQMYRDAMAAIAKATRS